MRISLEISTVVEFDFVPDHYPQGFTPQQALALELEQASQDPHEYLALPKAWTHVEGRLLREPRQLANGGQVFDRSALVRRESPGH
jgi:hypothetical protein